MIKLFECRSCGIITTQRRKACPACKSGSGNTMGGTPFRGLRAKDFMELLGD